MNWEALGATAEFLGAIAVFATLAYLAVQIRQSTKVAKAQSTKDLFLTSRAALMDLARDPELAKFAGVALGVEDPDEVRQAAFFNSFFRLYELNFQLADQDLLDPSIAASYEMVIRLFTPQQAFQDWWAVVREAEYQGAFAEHIDRILAE